MDHQKLFKIFNNTEASSEGSIKAHTINIAAEDIMCLLYKDDNGLANILIESNDGYINFEQFRGISVENVRYHIENIVPTDFYQYRCTSEVFHVVFFPFIADILLRISAGETVLKSHSIATKIWKNFLNNPYDPLMSVEKEIGLIGELIFLGRLLKNDFDAIEMWTGPAGSIDFSVYNNLIEIKSTLKDRHTHTINGLDQLLPVEGKNLYVGSFRFELIEYAINDSINLSSLYNRIIEGLDSHHPDKIRFDAKLAQNNLSPELIALHFARNYILLDVRIYCVDDDFPVMTTGNLIKPLSSRISKIRYDIDLDGLSGRNFDSFINTIDHL